MTVHTELSPTEGADPLALRELFDAYAHCANRRDAEGQKALFTDDTRFAVCSSTTSSPCAAHWPRLFATRPTTTASAPMSGTCSHGGERQSPTPTPGLGAAGGSRSARDGATGRARGRPHARSRTTQHRVARHSRALLRVTCSKPTSRIRRLIRSRPWPRPLVVRDGYCRAIATRRRSSGVIRWSASSASAPRSICTHLTSPVKTLCSPE